MLLFKDFNSYFIVISLTIRICMINNVQYECKSKIGRPKAPFSLATIPRCRGGHYSFPRIAPLTLDPYLIKLGVKQDHINFFSLWYD